MNLRKRLFKIVEPTDNPKDINRYFDIFIMSLILLNVLAIILESEPVIRASLSTFFRGFECFSVLVFSIEYVIRIWTIVENRSYQSPVLGRLKFVISPMAIIDLLAILPFYLPFVGVDLRVLRILRLFRFFRIIKMARYTKAFTMVRDVFREKKEELLVITVFISILLVLLSTIMYYLEGHVQPEIFGSIPRSLWWGIITLTTVGYGDAVPVTAFGQLFGGIVALLGIGFIALPTGILASGFSEQISKYKERKANARDTVVKREESHLTSSRSQTHDLN